jgi:RND family efflux transporter MFP subunit
MAWLQNRKWWLAASVLLVVALAAVGFSLKAKQATPADPKAAPTLEFVAADLTYLERAPLRRALPVSGALQPVRQAIVKAKVSGEVRDVTVREGQPVAAGQLLARFDLSDLEAKLADRIGAQDANRAQFALAEKNRELNRKLLKQNFISQNAFDSAESSYLANQGNLQSAQAQVQLAKNALRDAHVVSPLAGVVSHKQIQAGEKVPFDAPLFTIVDLSQLEMQALVPAADIPQVKPGMSVTLKVDGFTDRVFSGRVDRINPATEPGTRSIMVFVTLRNADQSLKAGMFAAGDIALAATDPVPTLPLAALRSDGDSSFVWAIEQGRLKRMTVKLGRRDELAGRAEIVSALPPALPVVGGRFDNLKEGGLAQIKPDRKSSIASPDALSTQVSSR